MGASEGDPAQTRAGRRGTFVGGGMTERQIQYVMRQFEEIERKQQKIEENRIKAELKQAAQIAKAKKGVIAKSKKSAISQPKKRAVAKPKKATVKNGAAESKKKVPTIAKRQPKKAVASKPIKKPPELPPPEPPFANDYPRCPKPMKEEWARFVDNPAEFRAYLPAMLKLLQHKRRLWAYGQTNDMFLTDRYLKDRLRSATTMHGYIVEVDGYLQGFCWWAPWTQDVPWTHAKPRKMYREHPPLLEACRLFNAAEVDGYMWRRKEGEAVQKKKIAELVIVVGNGCGGAIVDKALTRMKKEYSVCVLAALERVTAFYAKWQFIEVNIVGYYRAPASELEHAIDLKGRCDSGYLEWAVSNDLLQDLVVQFPVIESEVRDLAVRVTRGHASLKELLSELMTTIHTMELPHVCAADLRAKMWQFMQSKSVKSTIKVAEALVNHTSQTSMRNFRLENGLSSCNFARAARRDKNFVKHYQHWSTRGWDAQKSDIILMKSLL